MQTFAKFRRELYCDPIITLGGAFCLTYLKQDSWNVSQSFSIHVTLISFEKIWASANLITMFSLGLQRCYTAGFSTLRNLETLTSYPSAEVRRCWVLLALVLANIWRGYRSFLDFQAIIGTYHEPQTCLTYAVCHESRSPPDWVGNNKVRIVVLGCCLPCHVGFQFAMLAGVKLPCPLSLPRRGVWLSAQ